MVFSLPRDVGGCPIEHHAALTARAWCLPSPLQSQSPTFRQSVHGRKGDGEALLQAHKRAKARPSFVGHGSNHVTDSLCVSCRGFHRLTCSRPVGQQKPLLSLLPRRADASLLLPERHVACLLHTTCCISHVMLSLCPSPEGRFAVFVFLCSVHVSCLPKCAKVLRDVMSTPLFALRPRRREGEETRSAGGFPFTSTMDTVHGGSPQTPRLAPLEQRGQRIEQRVSTLDSSAASLGVWGEPP